MYREVDEVTKLRAEVESLRKRQGRSHCYLSMAFNMVDPGLSGGDLGYLRGYVFERFVITSSPPWQNHTFRGYVQLVFFSTEGDTYADAEKQMVEAAKYLAPLLKESPWPKALEYLKERGLVDVEP